MLHDSLLQNTDVPFFETVIRYLGGLLSAYALSKDSILLDKADELATKLSPAFSTSSGFPHFAVDTYKCADSFIFIIRYLLLTSHIALVESPTWSGPPARSLK